jgi:hypothetical protein
MKSVFEHWKTVKLVWVAFRTMKERNEKNMNIIKTQRILEEKKNKGREL